MLLTLALLLLLLITVTVVAISWEEALRRRWVFIGIGVAGVVFAIASLTNPPRPSITSAESSERWAVWRGDVIESVSACPEQTEGAVCLANALARHAPPAPDDAGNAARFFRDMNIGEALLSDERTRDLLWDEFGIDSADFLGTGYSAPRGEDGGYEQARQLEFFAPNLCADAVDLSICPREVDSVWTWRLNVDEAQAWLDRPAADFLVGVAPADHAAQWRQRMSALESRGAYIRFARFPAQFYSGTVGRASANLVFFAALPDPRALTLREVMLRTGSAALTEPGAADETLFIWIYAPAEPPPAATWSALLDYLDTL